MTRLKVILAEDHPAVRRVIEPLIEREHDLIATIERGDELAPKASEMMPEAMVLDVSLPGLSGLRALPALRKMLPWCSIVILTNHSEPIYMEEAFARGADAYVLKVDAMTELLPAITMGYQKRTAWRQMA